MTNANNKVIVAEKGGRRIGFGARISNIQCGINLVSSDTASFNMLMDEMDRDCNMFDAGSNGVGFIGINAGLAVQEDGMRTN